MDTIASRISMLRNDYDGPNSPGLIVVVVLELGFFSILLFQALASLSVVLYHAFTALTAHTAASLTPDRVTLFRKWLSTTFAVDSTEAEKMVGSHFLTAMYRFNIGVMFVLLEWTRKPVLCMFAGFMIFCATPRSWRVRVYEAFNSCVAWLMTQLGLEWGNSDDEALTETDANDREKMETKDEEPTDADDTDDSWSSGLRTPSETESSHSSGPSTSTNNIYTGRGDILEPSVRVATRAGFEPEVAASYLNAFILPSPVQDPQKRVSNLQDVRDGSTTSPSTTKPISTSEQIPYRENMTMYSGMLSTKWENDISPD
jgi:hypothetical protein